jgi:hypothetical protein
LSPDLTAETRPKTFKWAEAVGRSRSAVVRELIDENLDKKKRPELHVHCQIFTTDKDFKVYRRKGRSIIPLLAPF